MNDDQQKDPVSHHLLHFLITAAANRHQPRQLVAATFINHYQCMSALPLLFYFTYNYGAVTPMTITSVPLGCNLFICTSKYNGKKYRGETATPQALRILSSNSFGHNSRNATSIKGRAIKQHFVLVGGVENLCPYVFTSKA